MWWSQFGFKILCKSFCKFQFEMKLFQQIFWRSHYVQTMYPACCVLQIVNWLVNLFVRKYQIQVMVLSTLLKSVVLDGLTNCLQVNMFKIFSACDYVNISFA